MADGLSRYVQLERGQIDLDTGEFPLILASDGEATDGHVLSIEGAQFAESAPLQLSHINDVRATAGTVTGFRRDLQSSPKKLRARGVIELGGEGTPAEIRRDLAFMVSRGHIAGISVSWTPIKAVPRASLPKDHPAFVNERTEKDHRKRNGMFFERWRVDEGSLVAVQADKQAFIGRAEELEQENPESAVAKLYRAMFADEPEPETERAEEPEVEVEAPAEPDHSAKAAAFAAQVREFVASGVPFEELHRALLEQEPKPPEDIDALKARIALLEAENSDLHRRVFGDPTAPMTPGQAIRALSDGLEKDRAELSARFRSLLAERLGRVNTNE